MLYIVLLILGLLSVLASFIQIGAWFGVRRFYKIEKTPTYHPKVCAVVPCKAVEKRFRENIQAICNQDYDNYNIVFVTDSTEDPAYKLLKKMLRGNSKSKLVVSDLLDGCSGKISALIAGIKNAGKVDVYVFADSDIKPHKEWLKYLVAPLEEDNVGASTGYRWFFPYDWTSLLVSTWNMTGMIVLFYPSFNYAWGGSTAIRKKVFDNLDIETKWRNGYSDDLILTKAVRKGGYSIKLVPQCIVESFFYGDIRSFIRFGTRQLTWVKWYQTSGLAVRTLSVILLVGLKVLPFLGFILLILGYTIPGLLMISRIFLDVIIGWLSISTLKKIMWYPVKRMSSNISFALMTLPASIVLAYNNLASSFKKEIQWGSRTYRKNDVKKPEKKI